MPCPMEENNIPLNRRAAGTLKCRAKTPTRADTQLNKKKLLKEILIDTIWESSSSGFASKVKITGTVNVKIKTLIDWIIAIFETSAPTVDPRDNTKLRWPGLEARIAVFRSRLKYPTNNNHPNVVTKAVLIQLKIRLTGQVLAASKISGVTLAPKVIPKKRKMVSLKIFGILKEKPSNPPVATATAGPVRNGAGKCISQAISAPTHPTRTVITVVNFLTPRKSTGDKTNPTLKDI